LKSSRRESRRNKKKKKKLEKKFDIEDLGWDDDNPDRVDSKGAK